MLAIPLAHGLDLAHGVLLDDRLPQDVRARLDADARERLARWRAAMDRALTIRDACIPWIWDTELLAEVFLAEVRTVEGVRHALAESPPSRLVCSGLAADVVACLASTLADLGVTVETDGEPAPPQRYPTQIASPWRIPLVRRLGTTVFRVTGLPQWIRGNLFVHHYARLTPLLRRLAHDDELVPVLDPIRLPLELGLGAVGGMAARGGWIGHPGALALRRSRRELARALSEAPRPPDDDPLGELTHRRALSMLAQRAGETVAFERRFRRAFGSGRIKLALLPFDSPQDARMTISAARANAVPTLVAQHGAPYPVPDDPDRRSADHVAAWSARDAADLESAHGEVTVTGNPGAEALASARVPSTDGADPCTLILVDGIRRLSTRADWRLALRQVDAALAGLEASRPGTLVVIRPHPSEPDPGVMMIPAARHPGVRAVLDTTSSIAELAARADLCVAGVSTAALEIGLMGVPMICLNASGAPTPWPLDGSGEVPLAETAEELAELVPRVLASGTVPGRDELRDSMGAVRGASDRLVDLLRDLVR